jgi:osmoprotectant transport system substrate-binding protein
MKIHRLARVLAALALLVSSLAIAACGDDEEEGGGGGGQAGEDQAAIQSNPDNKATTVTVGSKNFTEQLILGEAYSQALQAAGYTVKKQLNLGDEKTAKKALDEGEIDAYPEYTGTVLQSFYGAKSDAISKDPTKAYEQAKQRLAKDKLTAYPQTPYTNSNEVALTKEKADELGVKTISDLAEHDQDLTLYGTPECRQRLDCLRGLEQVYGLKFKKFVPVDVNLRNEVLKKGQADLSIVFTTDPQIVREGFVLLDDDKNMFPPFNITFMVRDQVVQEAGADLPKVVDQVSKGLTDEVIQELNARVDLDKKTPEVVAGEYLKESGLIK